MEWLVEPLMDEPSYMDRPMFGCLGCYMHGRLVLLLCEGEEPWNGIMLPTFREHHASLRAEFVELQEHPVLGKWLYLLVTEDNFETVAGELMERIRMDDQRFGVPPSDKKRKRKATAKKTAKKTVRKKAVS